MIRFIADDLSAVLTNAMQFNIYDIDNIVINRIDTTDYGPSMHCSATCSNCDIVTDFTIRMREDSTGLNEIVAIDIYVPLLIFNDKNREIWYTELNDDIRKLIVSQLNRRKDFHSVIELIDNVPTSVSSMFYDLSDYEISGKSILENHIVKDLCRMILDTELNSLDNLLNLCINGSTSEKMYILKTG